MMRTLLTVAFLLIAQAVFAQNPCTVAPANVTMTSSSNQFFAELPSHNVTEPDGTQRVASYQYGVWLATDNVNTAAPSQGLSTIPRSAFVLVTGTTNCYQLTGGLPGLIPTQTLMKAALRAQSQVGAPQPFSAWAVSNSFSLASPRVTPEAPGQVRIRP